MIKNNNINISDALAAQPAGARRGQLRKTSISQQVYETLRSRIIALELLPGTNLSRTEIAEYYGVSQTPVRDAMLKLEEEGLLLIFPQSKTEVSRIDIDQARETQFLRTAMEIAVVKKLANADEVSNIDSAKLIISRQTAAHDAKDLSYFEEQDRAFHRALFNAVGMDNLWTMIVERSGQIDRLRKLNLPVAGKTKEIIQAHTAIISAIERKDPVDAEAQVSAHLSGTLNQIDQIVARNKDFFIL